jgi:ribosomal protein L13E
MVTNSLREESRIHHIKPVVTMQKGKKRAGKGFSPDEIKQAGLNLADARKLKIPIDFKRKTAHEENINCIKTHKEKVLVEAKPEPKPEKPAESKKKPKS